MISNFDNIHFQFSVKPAPPLPVVQVPQSPFQHPRTYHIFLQTDTIARTVLTFARADNHAECLHNPPNWYTQDVRYLA